MPVYAKIGGDDALQMYAAPSDHALNLGTRARKDDLLHLGHWTIELKNARAEGGDDSKQIHAALTALVAFVASLGQPQKT